MHRILKYNLRVTSNPQMVMMPPASKILTVQLQHGELAMWAEVDEYQEYTSRDRYFRVFATGESFDNEQNRMKYIATVQAGAFVWHVFEE